MRPTPISREIIDRAIEEYGIQDYGNATIREVKAIAARAERESGQEFIKMEMGIPGLPAAKIGVEAQIKALQNGCARLYPFRISLKYLYSNLVLKSPLKLLWSHSKNQVFQIY